MAKKKDQGGEPLAASQQAFNDAGIKAGFDLDFLTKLWEGLMRFGPAAAELVRQMIEFFTNPQAPQAALDTAGHHDCDHEELCLRTLQSAICAAHCAATHYVACCQEHDHEEAT